MTDAATDHELEILSQLQQNTSVKQRDIAHAIGLSLGMTNSILRRLVTKGFVTMRKINARNIHYLVTPEGIDLIARRSYRYLRRTVGHVVRYKERLLGIFGQAALPAPEGRGATAVVLVGESDLDFVVEWCAEKCGLGFARAEREATQGVVESSTLLVLGELERELSTSRLDASTISLAEVLLRRSPEEPPEHRA